MISDMFSRRSRRPKSADLVKAWECLDSGDLPGAVRQLRAAGEDAPVVEVALVVERAARAAGFDDLAQAAAALAARPDHANNLFDFGYACVERGLSFLAIPPLRTVLNHNPGAPAVLRELVSAYEREERHQEAMTELARHEGEFADWPDRYLLVYNALMAGELDTARRQHARLPEPEDAQWLPTRDRQTRMLERAAALGEPSGLRDWQYVIGGQVLGTLSPFGFAAGMAGRYAWLQDSPELCLAGLRRLAILLAATRADPRSVSLLPDRGSRILGLAAAEVLDLPAVPFEPDRPDTVVVAYDLNELAGHPSGPEVIGALFERAPGQVLHEHASCWTDTPAVTADSIGLLHQSVVAPWGERLRVENGEAERAAADERPEEEPAAEIVRADATPDEGDGEGPADPDERFAAFAESVRDSWLTGDRARVNSSGPVHSSRFA
ncbi:hypothetical protein ACGFZQ_38205 [Streptomyces sp. NPDC048254]|uniref:hypothetical protein n=1 Tax=Streptomyces sp. NPDC048254 TaxID=3365525 RepID=UPI003720689D